jgi:adenosine deaminase
MRVVAFVLTVFMVFCVACGVSGEQQRALNAEAVDNALTEASKGAGLRHLMQTLPKGGDLHNHLDGAIYAETWLDWAAEDGLCVDLKGPAIRQKEGDSCAGSGWITAQEALENSDYRHDIIDALSVRSFVPGLGWSGRDQFFDTFDRIAVDPERFGDELAEAARAAGKENTLYLELMETFSLAEITQLVSNVKLSGDLAADYRTLMSSPFGAAIPELVASARRRIQAALQRKDVLLKCGTPDADPGCSVEIRLIHQVLREYEPAMVFAQFILGWNLMASEPLMVGANLVGPEDGRIALRDYTLHMRMIDYLYNTLGPRNIALHAGELTLEMVGPRELHSHIRQAIDIGHAKRIGHGVSIEHEDDMEGLLELMAEKKILVEINLTSNETILDVSGQYHPVVLYRDWHVPFALSTDDAGVFRIDLTNEYVRFVRDYDVSYAELREADRNSLTYSFLPGDSLWDNKSCVEDVAKAAGASADCQGLLDGSEKARMQWKLEERLQAFERHVADGSEKPATG